MAFPTATAIESGRVSRRAWLALAAAGAARTSGAAAPPLKFAAAWDDAQGSHVGVVERRGDRLAVRSALPVPTRCHGLLVEPEGSLLESTNSLLAVARRPGDWMLRWRPGTGRGQWLWIEAGRAFNGHVIASHDGRRLYTTETDLDSCQGLVGVRDTASLRKLAEWPTHGADPHELLLDTDGSLLVANGGIVTHPESGRRKLYLDRMDSSLVRLSAAHGQLLGQWRLQDTRLGMRHVAWGEVGGRRILGIALQAEHDEPQIKGQAPVFALFDGERLRPVQASRPLAGYGGDIAYAAGSFAVSCTRAHGVASFGADGSWSGWLPLASACALTAGHDPRTLWAAGCGRQPCHSRPCGCETAQR